LAVSACGAGACAAHAASTALDAVTAVTLRKLLLDIV
jgi:hypothetical protein